MDPKLHFSGSVIGICLAVFAGLSISVQANAQSGNFIDGYKQVKRLGGNSQSICRPGIESAEQLQSFAASQRQDVLDILQNANLDANPELVFQAIAAGNFVEKSYPVGTKLEWMGLRKDGKAVASPKRQWAGEVAFQGFELNIEDNCKAHQLVIPKLCCNVSLVKSTPVGVTTPVITVNKDGKNTTIKVNSFGTGSVTRLTYPDGHTETLPLTNGSWTGTLEPGSYSVEALSTSECGNSVPIVYTFNVAVPVVPVVVPMASASAPTLSGPFLAPFVGRQVRSIDPPLIGIQGGWLNAINEKTDWLIQGGASYNLDASELSIFVDLGIERKFGNSGGFFGGGLGLWDINNNDDLPNSTSPKNDLSYFIHGGSNTPWQYRNQPIQWFAEARIFDDFTDDISHHNILKLGLRFLH